MSMELLALLMSLNTMRGLTYRLDLVDEANYGVA